MYNLQYSPSIIEYTAAENVCVCDLKIKTDQTLTL